MASGLGETVGVDSCTASETYRTYLIQATDPTGNTATAVASSLCEDIAPAGYVKVAKERSGLAYDYYIMSFEAALSDSRGLNPDDAVIQDAASLSRCSHQFHREGVELDASCGRIESEVKAVSQIGITPARDITYAQAYAACRNASTDQYLVRLPSRLEWLKAANWLEISYDTMRATYANVCNIRSANLDKTGDRATCRNDIGIYDVAGNLSEFVDEQIVNGSALPNGIDHTSRSIVGDSKAVYMGSNFNSGLILNQKIGINVESTLDIGTSSSNVGFRCVAFARNSTPTMTQLSKPFDATQKRCHGNKKWQRPSCKLESVGEIGLPTGK